jgi:ubiquinone/menaquinone biosynthesis C-methylase UbiE
MADVQAYYNSHAAAEWARLDRHRTEFAVTLRALAEFLPPPPASVLDLGGGPGRYAIALTRKGYAVTLADVAQGSLALAQAKAAEAGVALHAIVKADALDLSTLPAEQYDHVLLMGPLYHMTRLSDRRQALHQARRVLKPGGCMIAAFITRFAAFRDAAVKDPYWIMNDTAYAVHWSQRP